MDCLRGQDFLNIFVQTNREAHSCDLSHSFSLSHRHTRYIILRNKNLSNWNGSTFSDLFKCFTGIFLKRELCLCAHNTKLFWPNEGELSNIHKHLLSFIKHGQSSVKQCFTLAPALPMLFSCSPS